MSKKPTLGQFLELDYTCHKSPQSDPLFALRFGDYARMNFTSFNDSERTKTVHYVFMSLAYGTVMTLAVNAHRILPFTRDTNRHLHAALHTVAIGAISLAFAYIYLYIKISGNDGPHWGNLHSQFGLGIVSLSYALYVASGIIWYALKSLNFFMFFT